MKALVIYDSFFGNTKTIAEEIGKVLAEKSTVQVANVKDVKPDDFEGIEILVVGSPTRAFRPTPAIAEFLKSLPEDKLNGVKIAGFDTRADLTTVNSKILNFMVRIFGYAAEPIEKLLVKKGGTVTAKAAGFLVLGEKGPLKDGEIERAKVWADKLK